MNELLEKLDTVLQIAVRDCNFISFFQFSVSSFVKENQPLHVRKLVAQLAYVDISMIEITAKRVRVELLLADAVNVSKPFHSCFFRTLSET